MRPPSIRRRLTVMSALASIMALVVASSSFLLYEVVSARRALVKDLTSFADMLAFNVTAPLLFNDPDAATTSLQALQGQPNIRWAMLTDRDGKTFASYGQPGPAEDLRLTVPVLSEGQSIGTLTLESNWSERDERIRRYLMLTGLVLFAALLAAWAISAWQQRRILQPIKLLTDAAEQVSRKGDYSLRVSTPEEDELGLLAVTFNEMLGKIKDQDAGLRASEERYRALFESTPLAKWVHDPETLRFLIVNEAAVRQYGFTSDEFLEMKVTDLEAEQGPATAMPASGPRPSRHRRKDGSVIDVEVNGRAITLSGRAAWLVVAQDVTERLRNEKAVRALADENARLFEEAREAVRVRDDFLAIASHELRTPLTPLQLMVQALGKDVRSFVKEERQAWYAEQLRTIQRSARRLARLVNELLDISRIVGGRLRLEPEEVDLGALVREVIADFEAHGQIASSRCTVRVSGDRAQIVGRWDRLRLTQILVNLLSNALKYGAGKPVSVSLSSGGGRAMVRVVDQGIGIASQDHERIFGRFERAVSSRHYGGLGLGLFISRQIVEAMGGSIEVASSPGKGAAFTITLPLEPVFVGMANSSH